MLLIEELDEIEDYEILRDKVIQILKDSHDNGSDFDGIDYAIKHLTEDLKMVHWEQDNTNYFLSHETEIIVVLDSIDGYHIYIKETRGQW